MSQLVPKYKNTSQHVPNSQQCPSWSQIDPTRPNVSQNGPNTSQPVPKTPLDDDGALGPLGVAAGVGRGQEGVVPLRELEDQVPDGQSWALEVFLNVFLSTKKNDFLNLLSSWFDCVGCVCVFVCVCVCVCVCNLSWNLRKKRYINHHASSWIGHVTS